MVQERVFFRDFCDPKKNTSESIRIIDSTIVRAHQHAAGAKGGQSKQGFGRSVGGFSSKVHMSTDAYGNPDQFFITGGQEHDIKKAVDLTKDASKKSAVAADKG